MPVRPLSRLLVATTLVWAAFVGAAVLDLNPLRIALGVPVALLFPGMLTAALLGLRTGPIERWALVVGASIGWVITAVVVVSFTPAGITARSTIVALGVCTAALSAGALIAVRVRSASSQPDPTVPIDLASAYRPSWSRDRRAVVAWSIAGMVVAGSLAGGAWLSVVTAAASAQEHSTQLSLVRQGDSDVYRLTVVNIEGRQTTYSLELAIPGGDTTEQTITLGPQQSYQHDVVVTNPGKVVATLRGGSPTYLGYRRVQAVIS